MAQRRKASFSYASHRENVDMMVRHITHEVCQYVRVIRLFQPSEDR